MIGGALGPGQQPGGDLPYHLTVEIHVLGVGVTRVRLDRVPDRGHERRRGAAVERAPGVRGHRQRLDLAVVRGVVVLEVLVVRQVAGPGPVVEGHHQAWLVGGPADAGGRLDVLGGVLGLAGHDHQPEPGHVHADLQHARGQHDIDRKASGSPRW